MNKELINMLEDLRDFSENRVPINLKSLINTIKEYGYNVIASEGERDARLGIFNNFIDPFRPICVIHFFHTDKNNILMSGVTNSVIKGIDFVSI